MDKKIIIANWKMNSSFDQAEIWVENLSEKLDTQPSENLPEIVLCPPSIMIEHIDSILIYRKLDELEKLHKNIDEIEEEDLDKMISETRIIKLGAQDCSQHEQGSFTGDISALMISDCGASYVILGHSERRNHHAESDQIIAKKIAAALRKNLTPILCVGESKKQREENSYQDFIADQLTNSLPEHLGDKKLIIAYEPLWSIGTGLIPKAIEIEEIAASIKKQLQNRKDISELKIIYGGSVNKENAVEILNVKNIDGLLVGGASLDEKEFFEIIKFGCR
ncbi:MAG: triose-phosphate isomerase [Rickettsiaceae bacterium]|jgi:triosephosphate isomerase|nr:triose-phosphate isomerase [Rickettsiaceae bacterium]